MTPNETQHEAAFKLRQALLAAGLSDHAKVGYTGAESHEPFDGASADFEIGAGGRRVYCYRDEDGAWMIDAIDADIGLSASHPYGHGILIAYLVWATGCHDAAFYDLHRAGRGVIHLGKLSVELVTEPPAGVVSSGPLEDIHGAISRQDEDVASRAPAQAGNGSDENQAAAIAASLEKIDLLKEARSLIRLMDRRATRAPLVWSEAVARELARDYVARADTHGPVIRGVLQQQYGWPVHPRPIDRDEE